MANFRIFLALALVAGVMTLPVNAQQLGAQRSDGMQRADDVLDRVVRVKPIVTAIVDENVLYATVASNRQGRNDLAAKICNMVSRQGAGIHKVKIVDLATTRGGVRHRIGACLVRPSVEIPPAYCGLAVSNSESGAPVSG